MKTFYSAQEIEALARQGQRELVVDENTVLTDLARDAASRLGLHLVPAGRAAEVTARPAPAPPAAIAGRPRGCQHAAGEGGQASAAASRPANGRVVDDLVSAVKQMSKGS